MQKEEMIQLIEALASAGYKTEKFCRLNNNKSLSIHWVDIKILLSFVPPNGGHVGEKPFTKEKMTELIEILSSNGGYGILKFELVFNERLGIYNNIKLHLGKF